MTAAFIAGSALVSCVMAVNAELAGAPDASASLFGAPFRSGSPGGSNPVRGGAQGCAPFSYGPGWPLRKFPPGLRTRRLAAGGPPGCVSFAYFSLHKQRKVRPPRPAAPCVQEEDPSRKAIKSKSHRGCGSDHGEQRQGLRWPSPQPLSPTGTSFGRRRERGFDPRRRCAQRNSNRSASSIAGNFSRCATSASAEIVDVTTPSPAGNSTTGCPRKSITALSPL